MMFKALKKFNKAIKGSHAIETIIVTPIWLFIIFLMGYVSVVAKDRQTLADESTAIANIISISRSEEEAKAKIQKYYEINPENASRVTYRILEARTFLADENPENLAFRPYQDIREELIWKDGVEMNIQVDMATSFKGARIVTFNLFGMGTKYFLNPEISNTVLVTLNSGGVSNA